MKKIIPFESILIPDNAQRVFNGIIFDTYQWQQSLFDGTEDTFEMLKRSDTVNVICIVEDKIIVLDDEQPHSGSHKCFPAGRIEETDDSIEAGAKREVKEETGYSFKNWRLIKVAQPSKKIEWFVNVMLAWEVVSNEESSPDAGEKIKISLLDFNTVKELVKSRQGYLGENLDIFETVNSVQDLMTISTFQGQFVNR